MTTNELAPARLRIVVSSKQRFELLYLSQAVAVTTTSRAARPYLLAYLSAVKVKWRASLYRPLFCSASTPRRPYRHRRRLFSANRRSHCQPVLAGSSIN